MSAPPSALHDLHRRERRCLAALGIFVGMLILAPGMTALLATKDIIDLRRGTEEPLLSNPSGAFAVAMLVHAIGFAGAILALVGYANARHRREVTASGPSGREGQ